MNTPILTQLFAAPSTFHLGYDLFAAIVGALVLIMLYTYVRKIYNLTYKTNIALLNGSTYTFAIAYVLFFVGRYMHYAPQFGQHPMVGKLTQEILINTVATSFLITTTFSFVLLAAMAWKIYDKVIIGLLLAVGALSIIVVPDSIYIAILVQLVCIAAAAPITITRAIIDKKASSQWFALSSAILFLSIAQFFTPWSFHFQLTTYLFGTIVGFSLLFLSIRAVHKRARAV